VITLVIGLVLVALSTVVVTMVDSLHTTRRPKIAVQRRLRWCEPNTPGSVGFCGGQVGDRSAT
jgi:hypothetical protein